MLDTQRHETTMKRILRGLYQHPQLQSQLIFKGGTYLYLFQNLDRFSTDLDFSLHRDTQIGDVDRSAITKIVGENLKITADEDKRFTWFWLGSFAAEKQKIKIEINKRKFDDTYAEHEFYGLTVRTLDLASTFAHKLCAITDRKIVANRDLYDAWWLLKKNSPIRQEIILERTGKSIPEYLSFVKNFISQHAENRRILGGLGEVLSTAQKDWVRDHLLRELLFELQLRIERE